MNVRLAGLLVVLAACSTDPLLASTTTAPVVETTPTTRAPTTSTTVPPPTGNVTTRATTTTSLAPLAGLAYEVVAEGLTQPLLALTAPGDDRLYVVERPGRVQVVEVGGDVRPRPFLDITDRVADHGIEQGLLGLAFHPAYRQNGRVFAYYVGEDDNSRLVEYTADGETVDPSTEKPILSFDQAVLRHYAGMLQFGPRGLLWLSLGEGGAASVHSQDPSTLLSSILRLDVDHGDPYSVPADNPFVRGGGAPEVWAYGLRNPWRFDIDPEAGLLYVADVGHEDWEELNVVPLDVGGHNFGWLRMEGAHCFQRGCDPEAEGLTLPVLEYPAAEGCSIIGGFVYRGKAIPEVVGEYFFSDWCGGWLRSYRHADGRVSDWTGQVGEAGQVNGFGVDSHGELLLLTWEGEVLRLVGVRG